MFNFKKEMNKKNSNIKELPDRNELKDLVPVYLKKWENLQDYPEQEQVLRILFGKCPKNNDFNKVMIKVATLNTFYSTYLKSVPMMVNQILTIPNFDMMLEDGDPWLVDKICEMEGYTPFSFATKYCSHHNPTAYPIYDSFVAKVLTAYQERDHFTNIKTDLSSTNKKKSYEKDFYPIITEFQDYYNLSKYSYKKLDRFLWLLGKVHFGSQIQTVYYKSAQIGNYTIRIDKSGSVTVCVDSVPVSNAMEGMRAASRLLNGFEFKPGWNTQQTGRELVKYAIEYAECLPAEPEI